MAEPVKILKPKQLSHVRCSTVPSQWFGAEDYRLDAATYTQEVYEALHVIESYPAGTEPLGQLTGRIYHPTENQPRSNFKRIWSDPVEGVPFLTGRQLLFFRPSRDKFISKRMKKLDELVVPENTILVSRSGTTGYPIIVGKWLSKFAITDDALRVFPGSAPIGFVYAFLSSSLARPLMVRREYGKTVPHIEAKHIATVRVPRLPDSIKNSIHVKITSAFELRDRANQILDEAEDNLHKLIGVSRFDEADIEYLGPKDAPRAFNISSADFGARLDATHHVPLARSAVHKLSKGRFKLVPLKDKVGEKNIVVAPRFTRIYVGSEYGTPLLQGSHLPLIRPYDIGHISNTQTKGIERWIIRSGWVLVTCSGTIGRVAVSTRMQDGWAASQHILRIIPPHNVSAGFLAAFLSTPFGQHQLNAKIYGGVVDELTAEDTAEVLIPDIPFNEQRGIGDPVQAAYEMRDEAMEFEDQAIAELEHAIRHPTIEDDRDNEIARRRLLEIRQSPGQLVRGKELRDRLARIKN